MGNIYDDDDDSVELEKEGLEREVTEQRSKQESDEVFKARENDEGDKVYGVDEQNIEENKVHDSFEIQRINLRDVSSS